MQDSPHVDMNYMQIRILEYLHDHRDRAPVSLQRLRDRIDPNLPSAVIHNVLELDHIGLVVIFKHADETKMVAITPRGIVVYNDLLARRGCA